PTSSGSADRSHAELSALTTMLGELSGRVTALAETAQHSGRDELATGLYAVERDLKSALRRLARSAAPPARQMKY
ncbi:MAG: hypothetical protein ACRDL8_07275, partial [Solirubrobacteraceae bacterium]